MPYNGRLNCKQSAQFQNILINIICFNKESTCTREPKTRFTIILTYNISSQYLDLLDINCQQRGCVWPYTMNFAWSSKPNSGLWKVQSFIKTLAWFRQLLRACCVVRFAGAYSSLASVEVQASRRCTRVFPFCTLLTLRRRLFNWI